MSTRKEERQARKALKRAGKEEKKAARQERVTKRRAEGRGFGQRLKQFGLPILGVAANIISSKLGISSIVGPITKNLFNMANLSAAVTGSPKTTAAGIVGFIALIATQIEPMFDNDPETLVNWTIIINAVIALVMGFLMKDGDVSSKSIGLDEE